MFCASEMPIEGDALLLPAAETATAAAPAHRQDIGGIARRHIEAGSRDRGGAAPSMVALVATLM